MASCESCAWVSDSREQRRPRQWSTPCASCWWTPCLRRSDGAPSCCVRSGPCCGVPFFQVGAAVQKTPGASTSNVVKVLCCSRSDECGSRGEQRNCGEECVAWYCAAENKRDTGGGASVGTCLVFLSVAFSEFVFVSWVAFVPAGFTSRSDLQKIVRPHRHGP